MAMDKNIELCLVYFLVFCQSQIIHFSKDKYFYTFSSFKHFNFSEKLCYDIENILTLALS